MKYAVIMAILLLFAGCPSPTTTGPGTNPVFIVTFSSISDSAPIIMGPVIYRLSDHGPTQASVTVDNPEQYSSVEWHVNGLTRKGVFFTLDSTNSVYNGIGEHILTVEVIKNSIPYSCSIIFTVAE